MIGTHQIRTGGNAVPHRQTRARSEPLLIFERELIGVPLAEEMQGIAQPEKKVLRSVDLV